MTTSWGIVSEDSVSTLPEPFNCWILECGDLRSGSAHDKKVEIDDKSDHSEDYHDDGADVSENVHPDCYRVSLPVHLLLKLIIHHHHHFIQIEIAHDT